MFVHLFTHEYGGANNRIRKMMRLISYICVLIVVTLCALTLSAKLPVGLDNKNDMLTVFLTGYELGALKPCGCSGGQLGGLDRRSAVFDSVPRQKRLIIDTGMFVETDSEQDLIKFNIIIQALGMLDYDLVNLTEKDIEIGKNLGLLGSIGSVFNIISSYQAANVNMPAKFTKRFCLEKEIVTVTIAALDAKSEPIERVGRLFPFDTRSDLLSVDILILNTCDTVAIDKITKMGIVDCLVIPSTSDEPDVISGLPLCGNADPNTRPLIFSVGRFGRYIARLQIGTVKGKLNFSFSAIPVTENLPQEKSLVELYKVYQQLVKEAGLLDKYPQFILPDGLEYAGSESCKPCHEYEYEVWSQEPHSHAYATLEKVGSQFDPECVVCHVVGMKYESGFISEAETSHLKNVGCENCHGPGSEHNVTLGKAKTTEPKSTCLDCHTPETSGEYAGNEQFYLEKIIHWMEPNLPTDVK